MPDNLRAYHRLSQLPWPKSYLGKFLLTAFIGVHVPLIAVISFVVAWSRDWRSALPILLVTLGATLLGTLGTMLIQGRLLAPVLHTARALDGYVRHKTLPRLPTHYPDEAGRLMRHAQECVVHLTELLRLKNNLLAVLSHDARSPITSILFATEMSKAVLDTAPLGADDVRELREMNDVVRESARRQLDLMNNMLILARADTGKLEVKRGEVRLGDLIERTLLAAGPQARGKRVTLRTMAGSATELRVDVDAPKTEQVLSNLVHNAIKFTPAGGVVEVGAAAGEQEVELSVRDTGIGIPADALEHLFQPFSKAHRAGTGREDGSGLGLWICKTFTELQGGRIEVRSEPGAGSCFRVFLPSHAALQDAAGNGENRAGSLGSRLRGPYPARLVSQT